MRKLLLILAIIILLGMGTKPELDQEDTSFIEQFQSGITVLSNTIDIDHLKDQFKSFIQVILGKIDEITDETENKVENTVDKLPLEKPENQTFSIANIEIGYTEQQVKQTHGEPERISRNEYGTNWHTYHDHYQNFLWLRIKIIKLRECLRIRI